MRNFRRSPRKVEARTFRPNRFFYEHDQVRKDIATVEVAAQLKVKTETDDPNKFLLDYCKLKPYKHTLEIAKIYQEHQCMALRLPKQTGKSTTVGALIFARYLGTSRLTLDLLGLVGAKLN